MGELADEYADYIMEHSDYHIGNGDMLIRAMERGELLDDFCESKGITVEQFEEAL